MSLPIFPSELLTARRATHRVPLQADFAARNAGAAIFVREKPTGLAMLAVSPGRVILTVTGAIASAHIVGLLREAQITTLLGSDVFHALIDISDFTGTIDWQDIQAIREVMPKGDSTTNKNAYVIRNPLWMAIAKITAAYFPSTECAAFTAEAEARTWLGWE